MTRQIPGLLALLLTLATSPVWAAGEHVKWSALIDPSDPRSGESAQVVLTAEIDSGWHIYSLTTPDGGPIKTSIVSIKGPLKQNGKPVQPQPHRKRDPAFNLDVESFEAGVAFGIPVTIDKEAKGTVKASVAVRYQVCDARACLPPATVYVPVDFEVASGAPRSDHTAALTDVPAQPASYISTESETPSNSKPTPPPAAQLPRDDVKQGIENARRSGLLSYLWLSIIAGFAALFTPCVFPMIPITVSFFTKQKHAEGQSQLAGPIAYCLGIIGTFTGLGILVTVVFGASGINKIAASPWVNIALAAVFIFLAASLFGAFEIVLPSWIVNKAATGSRRGGLIGPLLMGFTFTLTSFTCTVPVVGTLLASAAKGDLVFPIVGMLAFSTAFALPFFLLALFPHYLAKMPKSGSWLVSVKAFMGFLELAAAAKFISNVDLVWQLGWITRPIFLAIWAGIFTVCGLYLLGWLRLPHEGIDVIGHSRRVIGAVTMVAAVYCLAAINGAPLGQLEAFPPPDPYPFKGAKAIAPAGKTQWIRSYEEGLVQAKQAGKAMFINFTGAT